MKYDYDVLIAGAGPAGSAAAKALAQNGLKVLLIDRKTFPREKVCGDGLTPGAVKLLNELEVFDFLKPTQIYAINAIRFVTPRLQALEVPFQSRHDKAGFLIIERRHLDHALLQSALHSGARFLQAEVSGLIRRQGRICGLTIKREKQVESLTAKLVIGADGAGSIVARSAGVPKIPPAHRFLAIRGYIKGFKTMEHAVEFIWTSELKPGYFWIFPTGHNQANIGLGLPADLYHKKSINLKKHFFELLNRPLLKERILENMAIDGLKAWPIPLAGLYKTPRVFDGAMLVGDAGYWVDPLSGEGIHNALKTGLIAANVALEAFDVDDFSASFLRRYEAEAWKELGPVIRRSVWFVRGMRYAPWLLESFFWFARHNQGAFLRFFSHLSTDFEFVLRD
ncbi:NAD(P)/FAD-dependent oxidoreductase [Caldithrix abyssi]